MARQSAGRRGGMAALTASIFSAVLLGCLPSSSKTGEPDATASPQASAMPAPLATDDPRDTRRGIPSALPASPLPEGGSPPLPLRGDVPLGPDTVAREATGYTLSAVLRPGDLVGSARAPEVNAAGIDAARKKTELRLGVELAASRMRVVLLGHGFVLPPDTEIRARGDRYGHVVVWPGANTYRPVGPGAMRALLGERRLDVAPLTPVEVLAKDDVGKRIGIRTRKVEVTTRAARAVVEVGRLPDLGESGVLLCRLLLDLMNAPPGSVVCGVDELPMRAELHWTGQGSLTFELTGVLKKTDIPASVLMVPPPTASYAASPPATAGVTALLSAQELAAFRNGPIDVPIPAGPNPEGLRLVNGTEELRVLYLDGVPVAWAAPGGNDVVPGLVRGRYVAQWRTFLGDSFMAPASQIVPGTAQVGVVDAGTHN